MPVTLRSRARQRAAFVLGNAAYAHFGRLRNPARDAQRIGSELGRLGFDVRGGADPGRAGEDLDRTETLRRWRAFVAEIRPGAEIFLYYAGHGLQIGGTNYIVPIDADLSADEPELELIPARMLVDEIAARAGREGKVIVALDACREDPSSARQLEEMMRVAQRGSTSTAPVQQTMFGKGFATFKLRNSPDSAPTFVMFATAPGELAFDGVGDNSPFALALVSHMPTRGLALQDLVHRVGNDVRHASGASDAVQIPWNESNFNQTFFFSPTSWRPVFELWFGAVLAGLFICWMLFDARGQLPKPELLPDLYYFLGAVFAPVVGYGTLRWGSGRWRDAWIAMAAATIAFMPALYILGHVQSVNLDDFSTWEPRLRNLMKHPDLVGVVFLCLLAGILYALVTFLGCKFQRGNFLGFATPAGAVAIGLGVGIGYLFYATIKYLLKRPELDSFIITLVGAGWFGVLGAGLGYAFRHYVPDHRRGSRH